MGELLKIDHVNFNYSGTEGDSLVLNDVSFQVSEGEFIVIIGPKGCGKSTLLSLIAGLLHPQSGSVYMNGKDIRSSEKNIGYMSQQKNCQLKDFSTNQDSGCQMFQTNIAENSYVQINKSLDAYGMITFINANPTDFSTCAKQRVALIRSLLAESDLILLDEPFSSFDYSSRIYAENDIFEFLKNEKKTVILVTSDISESIHMADRILVMSSQPGTIKKSIENPSSDNSNFHTLNSKEFQEYLTKIHNEIFTS